ncbi:hypothetical protein DFH07DRAFT_141489 [Mycena maculata]|uniref:F-box domain-containing protein n=1 Tax=Mycena maculata TaxID=230809 RepID=A0AAD7MUU7_9AGAR|nr:hypothetical protein DFH07DRAFT_141489 [Mycena maculata]
MSLLLGRFQALPPELHREIIKCARLPDIVSVSLTCRTFNHEAESFLYHTIVLHDTVHATQLWRAICSDSSRHVDRRKQIKHIGFAFIAVLTHPFKAVLSACDGIQTLAIIGWESTFSWGVAQLLEERMGQMPHLSRLTLDVISLCHSEPQDSEMESNPSLIPGAFPQLFGQLTHLDVRSTLEEDRWALWAGLASLPLLTHLAFHMWGRDLPVKILNGALAHCAALQVLVLLGDGADKYPDLTIRDDRFCIDVSTDAVGDWVNGCRGDVDLWTRAEMVIGIRRR